MGRLPNGQLQGYPIDFDHSIYVKDRTSDTGEPKEKSSALHRTGTAPFMALDHLAPPKLKSTSLLKFPSWHLPRYDMESFIWVLCWTMHHFKALPRKGKKKEKVKYRRWEKAPNFDKAFHDEDTSTARSKKFDWARRRDMESGEIDSSWDSLVPLMWDLVGKVVDAYIWEDEILKGNTRPEKPKGKGDGDIEMKGVDDGRPISDEFIQMDGKFKIDDIIATVANFYERM